MSAFIGRNAELALLDYVYSGNIRSCYIESRPRCGATTLVKRFCEKSKTIYTTFRESTPKECVLSFKRAIEDFTSEPISSDATSFADLFHILSPVVKEYEPILVFDGTHNAPPEFADQIRYFFEAEDVMVILIGQGDSDRYQMTFNEKFPLPELPYEETVAMHPKMSRFDAMRTYMVAGGTPLYHTMLNKATFEESVEKAFLGNSPKMPSEVELTLRKSSVPYPYCCAILSDLARFIGRPVDIAEAEGISRQLCDIYLKKLTDEGLVKTLHPIGDAPKKPVYIINNPLVAFYFIAIRSNPRIEFSDKPTYNDIARYIDMFMELRFRDICEQYIQGHFKCIDSGRWWIKEENTSKPTMVSIVDVDGEQKAVIADCKFREGRLDNGALKAFLDRSESVSGVPEKIRIMFSVSGFEDKLVKKAKAENVLLVGPAELGLSDR